VEQLAIGFLLGILTAGIGAVFQHQITAGAHDRATRRALVSEIRENMRRLGGPMVRQVPGAAIVRVAWDAARTLPLADDAFGAIADAYARGAELGRYADFIVGRVMYGGMAQKWFPEHRAREKVEALALEHAQATYDAFASALKLLERRDGLKR
jgi:hypothetical protein